jgi:hypothetical protein
MPLFEVQAPFEPAGDQPRAIAELAQGLARGDKYQTLLGVTGSGKTMTLAHVLANFGKPTLVLSHNKTLAASDKAFKGSFEDYETVINGALKERPLVFQAPMHLSDEDVASQMEHLHRFSAVPGSCQKRDCNIDHWSKETWFESTV